jgi:outer membrane lipoprotein SlyB
MVSTQTIGVIDAKSKSIGTGIASAYAPTAPNLLPQDLPARLKMTTKGFAVLLLGVLLTSGVAMADERIRVEEGRIEAIEMYRVSEESRPVGPGAVVGGIAGGVIGHQIGSGRGNTAATIVGAIGGAVVGNEIEKKQTQQSQATRYRIVVRLDSGSTLVVEDARDGNLRVGDRVRVEGSRVSRT